MQSVQIMGILNVTPNSFSDGGDFFDEQSMRSQIERLLAEGADCIDIGGESTKPFAEPVAAAEELQRILPAVHAVHALAPSLPISIDTTKAEVARAALAAGATIINDISALRQDPAMVQVALDYACPVIIMHMQGSPQDMQINPHYDDVLAEICTFFQERIAWMLTQGISREQIIIDPGLGFGKTVEHNLTILRNIPVFKELGFPVLIGHSRKSFFNKLFQLPVMERDCPTAVLSALCAQQGADILRVHDVAKTAMAVQLASLLVAS